MRTRSIIVGSIAGLIAAVAIGSALLLFFRIRQFSTAGAAMNRSLRVLADYYARDPFPSDENVKREKTNVEQLNGWLNELLAALRKGQIEPQGLTPEGFRTLFDRKRNDLRKEAAEARIGLPAGETFAFGFDRYFGGEMPAPANVPRLAQQLLIIEQLCHIIFEARIQDLTAIVREEFEGGSTVRPSAGSAGGLKQFLLSMGTGAAGGSQEGIATDAGLIRDGQLFGKFRFQLGFRATERALTRVLNRLATDPMFVVVRSLRIEKEQDDVLPPKPRWVGDGAEGTAGVPIPPDQRIYLKKAERVVSGVSVEKPMLITMELDVYRFSEPGTRGEG